MPRRFVSLALLVLLLLPGLLIHAQGTAADYERAAELPNRFREKVTQQNLHPVWVEGDHAFWYLSERGNDDRQWMRVASATGEQRPALDQAALIRALEQTTEKQAQKNWLWLLNLRIAGDEQSLVFELEGQKWAYDIQAEKLSVYQEQEEPKPKPHMEQPIPPGLILSPTSPNDKWRVQVKDHNLFLFMTRDPEDPGYQLTRDGEPDNAYIKDCYWSPDSTHLVAVRREAGDERRVTIVESAPDDQLQPVTHDYRYLKPGDKVPIERPRLFDVEWLEEVPVDETLAPNPYDIGNIRWKPDSSAFTYEYNQRGHQVYRVIEVNAATGDNRVLINETADTFIDYSSKSALQLLPESEELVWMSERDGWNHLYLVDWTTGEIKRQLTQGKWVVRNFQRVDREARHAYFWACGYYADQDPYFEHYCRVNLDTGEVTPLTASDGHHTDLSLSPNGKYLVTTWSRIDHPPVHELRDAQTGELIREIARADASRLIDAGWIAPEPLVAKGRDGETDIYGYLVKPTNFDPSKQYPVIEYIYAGPHDQHVEKRFYEVMRIQQLAELGFIVVRIDGMGTNWRSKAFHDVCWKNLKDAGFPDRIAWMKAAAQTRPWMDLERVGIYGGSAGGQNAMRAVLDHAEFYDAAAADCGCHDNRMDKIWWNEQWMGWPVDQSYIDSSNVEDAHKLGGALLLTVGELDRNVDPASTMQVVDALVKADKDFELIVFPGRGHGAGSSRYGTRRMYDFFVRELYGNVPRAE